MEPERPKIDRAIFGFLKSEALHRVNPQLAKRMAVDRGPDKELLLTDLACPQANLKGSFICETR
jgi:hypothetical protein